ncbi:phage antirepressor KilAC domain-containing protein [Brucella sp. TWI432]
MSNKKFPSVVNGQIGEGSIQTVNARELHSFLEVTTRFNDWINNRIRDFGFVENQDFVTLTENLVSGGKRKEFHLSLDMAKELSMVERNDKGKQARQYFIECERRAKDPLAALNDPAAMRGLLLSYADKVIVLEAKVEDMQEDVTAHERLTKADGSLTPTEAAKNLGIRPKDLFSWLSRNRWIYKRLNSAAWLGYQDKCNQGLLEHKTSIIQRSDGSEKITEQVRITAKGLSALSKLAPSGGAQ